MAPVDCELNHRIREGLRRWVASVSPPAGARAKLLLRASAARHAHRAPREALLGGAMAIPVDALRAAEREFLVLSFQRAFGILGSFR